jgi:glucosyl-dolichyl phosphate glucuronosyltransferase
MANSIISSKPIAPARDVPTGPGAGSAHLSIGVVICAYASERWHELGLAIGSVALQSRPAEEIVLVIDHNEALLARARDAFPGVGVVPNDGRAGLCGARNTGIRRVRSEIVAFLDDDARAGRDWLRNLATGFEDERVIGVGGWIDPIWEAQAPRWLPAELYWIVGCSYLGLPGGRAVIRNAIGANMSFRRQALIALGGFREDVGQGPDCALRDDETDLAIRARLRWPDARIMHLPEARVGHSVPAARANWKYVVSRSWGEGRGKALLAASVGASAALASERRYVARVLPAAVARGLLDTGRGDLSGLGRAASVVTALAVTVAGYAVERLAGFVRCIRPFRESAGSEAS